MAARSWSARRSARKSVAGVGAPGGQVRVRHRGGGRRWAGQGGAEGVGAVCAQEQGAGALAGGRSAVAAATVVRPQPPGPVIRTGAHALRSGLLIVEPCCDGIEEGGFYGWPWYYIGGNQDPRHRGKRPELKDKSIVPDVLLQPHSASLQMVFYDGKQFPRRIRGRHLRRAARLVEQGERAPATTSSACRCAACARSATTRIS